MRTPTPRIATPKLSTVHCLTTLSIALVFLFSLALFAACGSGEGAMAQSTGETECEHGSGGECGPGTYCAGPDDGCAIGCTSNSNCTSPQRCYRDSGEVIGVCAEEDPFPSSNNFSPGHPPLQPDPNTANCEQLCDRLMNWVNRCFGPTEQDEFLDCLQDCEEEMQDELEEAEVCLSCMESTPCDDEGLCDDACF